MLEKERIRESEKFKTCTLDGERWKMKLNLEKSKKKFVLREYGMHGEQNGQNPNMIKIKLTTSHRLLFPYHRYALSVRE